MKKFVKNSLVLLIAAIIVCGNVLIAFATDDAPSVKIVSPSMYVNRFKTLQMSVEITPASELGYTVVWESSDTAAATVDQNGLVKGINYGRSTITATVPELGVSDSFVLYVERKHNAIHDHVTKHSVSSFLYSYEDDFYYVSDHNCWQKDFGFSKFYDIIAPYVLIEYDYVRVFFTYQDLDWMIQLWKGQYGIMFYGSEVGVYTKPHSDKKDTVFTKYQAPDESNYLKIGSSLYRDHDRSGVYRHEFTMPYKQHWWSTGYKFGRLNRVEPAGELRLVTRITLKDEEMTKLFVEGLKNCGFSECDSSDGMSLDGMGIDAFYTDGCDVNIKWQNISEAENTMPIKITFAVLGLSGFFG
ncbi:MAG: DUF4474 domain-containing protein, partial [Clostridiales bacterium]|nr:DUF4474 domain-containing protein [Clostridiales bacterium]